MNLLEGFLEYWLSSTFSVDDLISLLNSNINTIIQSVCVRYFAQQRVEGLEIKLLGNILLIV